MGTTKQSLLGTAFTAIILLSCLEDKSVLGLRVNVVPSTVFVVEGGNVNITCYYNTDTYANWLANGTIVVDTLPGITHSGGNVPGQPGEHYNTLMIRNVNSILNATTFTCRFWSASDSAHLYILKPIVAIKEIAPVYPLNEEAPMLICWTPPPAYTVAPITQYHLKLTTSSGGEGDETNTTLSAELGTCAAMGNGSVPPLTTGGMFAVSLAAENVMGVSEYTPTSMIVNVHKGANSDRGSDGFTVTMESFKSSEGHFGVLVEWMLMYQWTASKFQFNCLCTWDMMYTHNVTMETTITNVTINGPFTVGEECVVRIKACLRDDGCAWAVTSKVHQFTAGSGIRKGWFSNTSFTTGLKNLPTFRPDALVFFRAKKTRASGRNVGKFFNPVVKLVLENQPFLIQCDFDNPRVSLVQEDGPSSPLATTGNELVTTVALGASLAASSLLFAGIITVLILCFIRKAAREKRLHEANVIAAIRSEPQTNPYSNSVPTTSEPCADIGASLNGCATVQYRNHNKPADEDAYMVMCGRKRSVYSPLPPELPPTPPELNKEALYAEIGNK